MIDVPVIILQWRLKMTLAGCILMMCVLVRSYTIFQDLFQASLPIAEIGKFTVMITLDFHL